MPLLGLVGNHLQKLFLSNLDDDLDGKWGNSIGYLLVRRWDNWVAYCVCLPISWNIENYFKCKTKEIRVKGTRSHFHFHWGGYTIPITKPLQPMVG